MGLVAILTGGIVAVAGPAIAGSWLRGEIERQANERIRGTVTVDDLSLSLNGKGTLTGLMVVDASGQLVASVPQVKVDVGIRSLLTGKRDISAIVTDAEFELERAEDGTWNFDGLLIPSEEEDDGEEDESESDEDEPVLSVLDLHGRIEVVNATVTLRSPDTALTLRDVSFGAGLDGKKRGLTIEAGASLHGGQGSSGDVGLKAVVWPKAGPGAKLTELKLSSLDLGAVQEAMLLVGAPLEEGSRLAGLLSMEANGTLAKLGADAIFSLEASAVIDGLMVDIRSDGMETMAFEDRHATATVRAGRGATGGEPSAALELRGRDDKLRADVEWDGAADVGLTVDVMVDALSASAGLEPLLARVHPVFASAQAIEGAAVDADVTSELHLAYNAPLALEQLQLGWAALPKEPLRATGRLELEEGLVEASQFLQKAFAAFDLDANPTFDMKPLAFALEGDRLRYTDPWTWTIQGTETSFVGSVGLDGGLDLRWNVPVTGGLAEQNRVLRMLADETLSIGLGGTMTAPQFDVAGAVSTLVQRATQEEIARLALEREEVVAAKKLIQEQREALERERQRLADDIAKKMKEKDALLEEIGVVDGGVEGITKKVLGDAKDAGALLKEADALWEAGKRKEAGVIYTRIRKDFSLSTTYLFNKKRIKKRRNG